jgi:uncharacterized protein (TIGR03437 family)
VRIHRFLELVRNAMAVLPVLITVLGYRAYAQPLPAVAGYAPPIISVAPGQVITLYLVGVSDVPDAKAEGTPLPIELGGISVSLVQADRNIPVPLFSIESVPQRPELRAVMVQIPYEVSFTSLPGSAPGSTLIVAKRGTPGTSVPVVPLETNVHVLTKCSAPPVQGLVSLSLSCAPAITHGDGSTVTASSPAKPGETLTMYAVGLGRPMLEVASGAAAVAPIPMTEPVWRLEFNFSPNTAPRWLASSPTASKPLWIGLAPGFVGLGQINFQVPETIPAGTPKCGNGVQSNLTISIFSETSFDGGAICVE